MVAEALTYDYREAKLETDDRGLCDYAAALSLAPGSVDTKDILLATIRSQPTADRVHIDAEAAQYFLCHSSRSLKPLITWRT